MSYENNKSAILRYLDEKDKKRPSLKNNISAKATSDNRTASPSPSPLPTITVKSTSQNKDMRSRTVEMNRKRAESDSNYSPAGVDRKAYDALKPNEYLPMSYRSEIETVRARMKEYSDKVAAAEINPHLKPEYTAEQRERDTKLYTAKYKACEAYLEKLKKEQNNPTTYEKARNDPSFSANAFRGAFADSRVHRAFASSRSLLPDNKTYGNDDARYLMMNESELSLYNYYIGAGHSDFAEDYLTSLEPELNSRLGTLYNKRIEAVKNPFVKHDIKSNQASASGFEKGISGIGDWWNRYIALDDSVPVLSANQTTHALNMENADGFTRFTGDALYSVGNMAPSVAASFVPYAGPALAVGITGVSTAGSSYADARREGKEDQESANYGLLEGTKEAGMQFLLGGISRLGGKLPVSKIASAAVEKTPALANARSAINKTVDKLAGNPVVHASFETAKKQLANMGDEAFEEYLQEIIEPAIRNVAFDEKNEFKPFTEEALYAAALGGVTAGVMNVPSVPSYFKNAKANATKKGLRQLPVNGLQLSEMKANEDLVHSVPQSEENVNKNFVPLPVLDKNGKPVADLDANEAVGADTDTAPATLPIKAGKVTTIYNPYIGDVPVKVREKVKKRVFVPEDALSHAVTEIEKARQTPEAGSIRAQLRNAYYAVFKSKGGQRSVVIEDLEFNKKPYAVSINTTSIKKIVSDKHLSAEKLALINCLDEVIANATYVGSSTFDRIHKKAKKTIRFDYFETPVKINNKNFIAGFDVEVFINANNYKTHKVINEMDLVSTNTADADPVSAAHESEPSPMDRVPQFEENVNKNLKKISKKREGIDSTTCGVNEKASPPATKSMPSADPASTNSADVDPVSTALEGEPNPMGRITQSDENVNNNSKKISDMSYQLPDVPKPKHENTLRRTLLDAGHSVYRAGKDLNDRNLYAFYNNVRQAQAAGQFMVTTAQTDISGKKVGKSLNEIFDPIKHNGSEYTDEFDRFLLCRHAIDREKAGKHLKVDDGKGGYVKNPSEEVRELLLKHPDFETKAEEVYDFNRNLLRYRVDSGLISQQTADMLNEKYPHYVPTHKLGEAGFKVAEGSKNDSIQIGTGIYPLRGGDGKILPIYEQMSKMTVQTVSQAKRNIFANRLEKAAFGNTAKAGYYVSRPISLSEGQTLRELGDSFVKDGTLLYYKNGAPTAMRLTKGMTEALTSLTGSGNENENAVFKSFRKLNNAYKSLITEYNPLFTVKNFTRDIADALFASKNTTAFLKAFPNAMSEMRNGGELWQRFEALGGTASSMYGYKNTTGTFQKSGKLKRNTLDRISEANRFVEMIPRFTEFYATVKSGDGSYECLMEAMHNAADITVNFQRGGTQVKALSSSLVPYFNAGIQGLSKNMRIFKDTRGVKQWAALIFKAALFGIAPTLINEFIFKDDDDYQSLRADDKRENYIIGGGGHFFKIPAGRLTKSMGNIVSEAMKAVYGGETDFWGLIGSLVSQLAPSNPLTSNLFSPVLNAMNNQTRWGGKIESTQLEALPVAERYDSNTSEIGKLAGSMFGLSPKKTDYIIDSYTGIAGDILLPFFKNPSMSAESVVDKLLEPIAKSFYIDSRVSNGISAKFYDELNRLEQKSNSRYADESDRLVFKYMNEQSRQASELYAQLRAADEENILPYAELQRKKLELYTQIGSIQKNALNNVKDFGNAAKKYAGADESTAYFLAMNDVFGLEAAIGTLGSETARKRMRQLTSVGIDAQTVLELSDRVKNAEKVSGSRTYSEAKSRKQRSIECINGTQLSDRQRAAAYDAYVFSDTDKKYSYIAKKVGLSDDIIGNVYGDLSVMEGEKSSSGKTISGSQNKNVYNYVNALDLPGEQKRLLFAWFASSTNEKKTQCKSVISNLGIAQGDTDTVLRWLAGDKTISDEYIEKIFRRTKRQ